MALIAADGSLVLWSPGGFAAVGAPADGRPTPELAAALATLPDLSDAVTAAEGLRAELDRAKETADQARLLLHRAAVMVDDEIHRQHQR